MLFQKRRKDKLRKEEKLKYEQKNKGNIIIALALMRYLYNKGDISEYVYNNIKKEYQKKIKSS